MRRPPTNSLATYTLLCEAAQRAALQADPSLVPSAVEELLRYLSVVHHEQPSFRDEWPSTECTGCC